MPNLSSVLPSLPPRSLSLSPGSICVRMSNIPIRIRRVWRGSASQASDTNAFRLSVHMGDLRFVRVRGNLCSPCGSRETPSALQRSRSKQPITPPMTRPGFTLLATGPARARRRAGTVGIWNHAACLAHTQHRPRNRRIGSSRSHGREDRRPASRPARQWSIVEPPRTLEVHRCRK